ncbi:MAG: (2Fe-2S) ferredoxin domain-containing protein, partial [Nitrospina sp.]|nr:(2Fe-2S) ferredoxin domain-containing protein [Nitrospina sp.]
PAMVVYPDDAWYSPKTKIDIDKILKNHIQNNLLVEELVINF